MKKFIDLGLKFMTQVIRILSLFLLFFLSSSIQNSTYPLNKKGEPTSKGIEMYVKQNQFKFIKEYQDLVGDTLYDVYMSTDNLSQYTDNEDDNNLGFCFCERGSSEIIITNEEKFMAYEASMLSKYKKRNIIESNTFVKGAIFHELTHFYFNQVILEMRMDSMPVSPSQELFWFYIYRRRNMHVCFYQNRRVYYREGL